MKRVTFRDLSIIGMYLAHGAVTFEPKKAAVKSDILTGQCLDCFILTYYKRHVGTRTKLSIDIRNTNVFPVLNRLDDLSPKLKTEYAKLVSRYKSDIAFSATQFGELALFIFSNKIDIYGLIDAGKAISYSNSYVAKEMAFFKNLRKNKK